MEMGLLDFYCCITYKNTQACHLILCCIFNPILVKGPFINYVRVLREGEGLEKSLHTRTLGGGGSNTFLCNMFQVNILY